MDGRYTLLSPNRAARIDLEDETVLEKGLAIYIFLAPFTKSILGNLPIGCSHDE